MRHSEKENSHYSNNDCSSHYSSGSTSSLQNMAATQQSKPRVPFGKINSNEPQRSSYSLSQSIKAFQDRNKQQQQQSMQSQQLPAFSKSAFESAKGNVPQQVLSPQFPTPPISNNYKSIGEKSVQSSSVEASSQHSSQQSVQSTPPVAVVVVPTLAASLKKATTYSKQSALYKCLINGVTSLKCEESPQHADLTIFCATCSEILCAECLSIEQEHSSHEGHCILNVHQFMEHPVLAFLQNEKLLSEAVSQNNLLQKIKEEANRSKKVLKEYLASIVQWITKQSSSICERFDGCLESKLSEIEKSISSIQAISSLFKNEWDNWITSNEILTKESLESLCRSFLNSSDNPMSSVKTSYDNLNNQLSTIPELNIQAFKDLYFRVCDTFRFSAENLVNQKLPSDINEASIISQLEQLQSTYSDRLLLMPASTTEPLQQVAQFVRLQETDTEKFLTISADKRTVHFIQKTSSQMRILNTLVRSEGEEVENLLALKDKKTIAICSSKSFELFSMQTGKSFYKDKMQCLSVCELPTQKILAADAESRNVFIYSLEDAKHIKRVGQFNPNMHVNHIAFTLLPSNAVFKDIKGGSISFPGVDQEIVALASSLGSGNKQFASEVVSKNVVQIWDAKTLQLVKCLHSQDLSKGVAQIQFISATKKQGQAAKNQLLILTNDSKLIVWDYLSSNSNPEAVFSLLDEKSSAKKNSEHQQLQVNQFEVIDGETILYSLRDQVLCASIGLRKIVGVFASESSPEEALNSQSDFDEYDSLNFSMKSSNSSTLTRKIFTGVYIARKEAFGAISYIATAKYDKHTNTAELEVFNNQI